jgi:hypothetical protein
MPTALHVHPLDSRMLTPSGICLFAHSNEYFDEGPSGAAIFLWRLLLGLGGVFALLPLPLRPRTALLGHLSLHEACLLDNPLPSMALVEGTARI